MDWMTLPSLNALRAFAAFAEHKSMSLAGQALNVSHAAISQQVRSLEDHLGTTLVDRRQKQLELTAEGAQLAEALALGFGAIERAVNVLTEADANRPLQISATPGFVSVWLMPRLSDFWHQHPDIDMMVNPTPELIELEPGGIDVAIRFGAGHWPGLEAEPLLETSLVVVAARSLVGEAEISDPLDLLEYPWLQELGTTESTDWFHQHGVTKERTKGLVQMPGNLVLEAARAGQGVVMTAMTSVAADIAAGRLRLLFEDKRDTAYYIVTRPGTQRRPVKLFVNWLKRQRLRQMLPLESGES
ncbi:LysR family transcriptional regulator [Aliiroseovarius sp. YM-037]|uniref:LysR family transcriptional regulator n=1 Tax=Aliiroseovarius sp. YM-037 TaxID=3341728 RepID=UPI003A7F7110